MSDSAPTRPTDSGTPPRRRLGEILVASGAIDADQLSRALEAQATTRTPLGQTLMALGFITDEVMRRALGTQLGVPYIDLDNVIVDRSLAGLIDQAYATEHLVMPVAQIGNSLTVAMDDPTSTAIIDDLARRTGWTIAIVTSSATAIRHTLRRLYEGTGTPSPAADAGARSGDVRAFQARQADDAGSRVAYAALAGLDPRTPADLRAAVATGVPARALAALASSTGIPADRLGAIVGSPADTSAALDEGTRLSPAASDRLLTVAWTYGLLLDLFHGDATLASAWLQSRQPSLDGAVPLALLESAVGAREVAATIDRLKDFDPRA
ncbi:MAG: antitoxin Xre/MbcA/ParS toxin-binding domain-containing protein [Vicinamibacterales bacterium]